ncbi:MAG: CRISPR-associated CARF protein Csa3 [Nitrososphaerota archaeon]
MRLIIVTIGFDEKLPLRGILKIGLDISDAVLIVYSKTGGEFEVKKVERAVEALKELVLGMGVKIAEVEVSGTNFYEDTATVLKTLKEYKVDEIVAVLAGGMRLVIFEVLFALLIIQRFSGLQKVRTRMLLMREDGLYYVSLSLDAFYVTLPARGEAVLRIIHDRGEIARSQLVELVSRDTGLSESAVYKIIKSLMERGFIVVEEDTVKLTELGHLVYVGIGE